MDRSRSARQHGDGPVERSKRSGFRWIDGQRALDAAVEAAADSDVYALDTEFHRERTYYPHLALIQLAWDGQTALVDPLAVDVGPLDALLAGSGLCIMHAASQDLEILERSCGTIPRRLVDTQVAAGFIGLGSPGLAALLERQLGVRLPKADRLTDWLRRPLPADAATYAATDVVHLVDLWSSLRDELEARGRLDWTLDECEELRRRHGEPNDPQRAWWRIKEARRLKGQARAVAQMVAAWRERRAQRVDRPIRHVLPDLAVVAIADRPPRSRRELQRVRGLDERHLRGGAAEELLDAIQAGFEASREEIQLPPRDGVDTSFRPAVTLAAAWVSQLARDADLDPALIATRSDIEALVRGDTSSRLCSGWRAEIAGGPVHQLLSGDAALAFDGDGSLAIEARSGRPLPG